MLRVKLRQLDARNARRAEIAAYYSSRLRGRVVDAARRSAPHARLPPVRHPHARARGAPRSTSPTHEIETGIHYPVPDPPPARLARRVRRGAPTCRARSRWRDEILSLPVHPDLTDAEVEHVAESVGGLLRLMQLAAPPAGALHRRPRLRRGGQRRAAARGAHAGRRASLGAPLRARVRQRRQPRPDARAPRGHRRAAIRTSASSTSTATSARPPRCPPASTRRAATVVVTLDGDGQNDPARHPEAARAARRRATTR